MMFRVVGCVDTDEVCGDVTVTVEANNDEHAQELAWVICPQMDINEIAEA